MWGALRQPFPPPEVKAMVVLQADGSVMAGAGGWGREGEGAGPHTGDSSRPPPEQTFLLPTHPTRPEAQSSHPCPAAPHSLRAPLTLIGMWEASLSRDPPPGHSATVPKKYRFVFL